MGTRLMLLKLQLVDVFAISLYNPHDLNLIEQIAGDVHELKTAVSRWDARRERTRLAMVGVLQNSGLNRSRVLRRHRQDERRA